MNSRHANGEHPARPLRRRLLVINPNTNPAVTDAVRQAAGRVIGPDTECQVINPRHGPFSIETEEHRALAAPQVVSMVSSHRADGYDAYVLACFDDIGLQEARALAGVPVVGTCEAGIAAARTMARRFAIITTVHSAIPGISEVLQRYGAASICSVRAAGIGVAAAAGDPQGTSRLLHAAMRDAIEKDGAEAILLGSGGLAGRADELRKLVSVPVIDGIQAAVKMAEGLAAQFEPHQPQQRREA